MKKTLTLIMAMAILILTCGESLAFDARGSAIATGFRARHHSSTSYTTSSIVITNITGSDVECKVTVFDHDGNDVSSICKIYTGSSTSSSGPLITSGTGTFDLPAAATRHVNLDVRPSSKDLWLHAVIEWSSTDSNLRKALIAVGFSSSTSGDRRSGPSFTINGGQPF